MWKYVKQELIRPFLQLSPYIAGGYCFYEYCYKNYQLGQLELHHIATFIILSPLTWMVLTAPVVAIMYLAQLSFLEVKNTPIWAKYQLSNTKLGFFIQILIFVLGAVLGPIFLYFLFKLAHIIMIPFVWLGLLNF